MSTEKRDDKRAIAVLGQAFHTIGLAAAGAAGSRAAGMTRGFGRR